MSAGRMFIKSGMQRIRVLTRPTCPQHAGPECAGGHDRPQCPAKTRAVYRDGQAPRPQHRGIFVQMADIRNQHLSCRPKHARWRCVTIR